MAITVICPACGKALNLKDEFAGKKGKCPACGHVVVVPPKPFELQPVEAPKRMEETPPGPPHPLSETATMTPRATPALTFSEASYWWLWIPVIGWLPFAIPIILPLGPIIIAFPLANRMRFIHEAAAHNGDPLPDSVGAFIGASFTLGYNSVLRTWRATRKMLVEEVADEPVRIPGWNPLLLPLYVLCPALVYMPCIRAMINHWRWHQARGSGTR